MLSGIPYKPGVMMRNYTCIVCPLGCSLELNGSAPDNLSVSGNICPRGEVYAIEEFLSPKRIVTATAAIKKCRDNNNGQEMYSGSVRRIPVKTTIPCPCDKITALLQDIYKLEISLPVRAGDVLIADWNREGIDICVTRTIIN